MNSSSAKADPIKANWILQIKADEINTAGREMLAKREGAAIGCDTSDHSSMVELRFLGDPHHWPRVKPRSTDYAFYYKDWQERVFPLKEAKPTSGLLDNWQGNVFRACEQPELAQYWRRFRTHSSITLKNAQELYWIARTVYQPEWPGFVQMIGQPQDGWQLWRLQIKDEYLLPDTSLVEFERWLSYRDIQLNYPRWRIHVLNPLYYSTDACHYLVRQDQPLLFECIPPSIPGGKVSLTIKSKIQQQFGRSLVARQLLSASLHNDMINYLRFQVPRDQQEYLLNVSGEAARPSLYVQVESRLPRIPDWLAGFQCCLKMADKHYPLYAFTSEPSQSHECSLLQVSEHFTLVELAQLSWDWSPAELPCSVRYEYPSLQGEDCHETLSSGTTAHALTMLWQNSIWDKVRDSSWVKVVLDAGSFGRIVVKFQLKSEKVLFPPLEVWWTNEEIVTALIWLSQSAQPARKGTMYPLSPAIQLTLQQLCQPDVPTHITAALLRLSSYKNISRWAYVRLQTLLAEIPLADPIITKK